MLQPQVPVQGAGVVLLDHERTAVTWAFGGSGAFGGLGGYGLGGTAGVAFAPVSREFVGHKRPLPSPARPALPRAVATPEGRNTPNTKVASRRYFRMRAGTSRTATVAAENDAEGPFLLPRRSSAGRSHDGRSPAHAIR
ncbi:hypothetical protein GCM10010486_25240 [Nonomuraea roseoviolacea subsp. carminata]